MNNELQIITNNGVDVVDSREVARFVGKQHKELLRDIHKYAEILGASTERNFALSDFFIESSYTDSTGRTLPCYLITKKGCDMVANKMTGEKGVLFTAAYVTAFERMREAVTSAQPQFSSLSPQLQALINIEMRQNAQEERITAIEAQTAQNIQAVKTAFDTMALPTVSKDQWQEETNRAVRQMCEKYGLNYQKTIGDMYEELERTAGVNLSVRQKNLRERMKRGGATYAERQSVSKLSIVSLDKKLCEIYTGIVRRKAARLAASDCRAL